VKHLRITSPFVRREADGYLVYDGERLLTPNPIDIESARAKFNAVLDADSTARVRIMSVHSLDHSHAVDYERSASLAN
jgi:hypothetical protein